MSERYLKGTCPSVIKAFGEEKGGRIVARMHVLLDELIKENPDDPKALQSHSYGQIYPLIAFYRAMLEEGMSGEEAYQWLYDDMMRMCAEMVAPMQKMMRFCGIWRKMPKLFGTLGKKMFGPDAGFVINDVEETKMRSRFDMMKCPYYDKFREYGLPELCRICCASDDATYSYLHPNLVFHRTKTLARGGDCCDFEFYRKK